MSVVDAFCEAFVEITPERPVDVAALYAPDVVFEDPVHRIEGRDALASYFRKLDGNLRYARFEVTDRLEADGRAALAWTMRLRLRVGPRREVVMPGTTWLRFGERIHHHHDDFDLGALVYEQVPLLGTVVRAVRRRMAR